MLEEIESLPDGSHCTALTQSQVSALSEENFRKLVYYIQKGKVSGSLSEADIW
jgi:hypothetical protein